MRSLLEGAGADATLTLRLLWFRFTQLETFNPIARLSRKNGPVMAAASTEVRCGGNHPIQPLQFLQAAHSRIRSQCRLLSR